MKIISDIGSKIVLFVIIVLLCGAGYVWVLKTFLNPPAAAPPPIASNSPEPSPASLPDPPAASSPTPVAADPTVSSITSLPSPILVPDSDSSPVADANSSPTTDTESSPMPAIALPEQVALKVPQKLEKGGILKLYLNNDDSKQPDPIKYSPSKVLKTPGLALINLERDQFSEVSGYFLVEKPGIYNFVITQPDRRWIKLEHLRTKIDGVALPTPKGGSVALDRGWHHIGLFLNSRRIDANEVRVGFGLEGETLKRLDVWREAQ